MSAFLHLFDTHFWWGVALVMVASFFLSQVLFAMWFACFIGAIGDVAKRRNR